MLTNRANIVFVNTNVIYIYIGYDPILYLPKYRKTVAELDLEQKNNISHRATAAKKILLDLNT